MATSEEDQAIIDEIVECFHTLSARVTWPAEPLKRRFEERLEALRARVRQSSAQPEQDSPAPAAV